MVTDRPVRGDIEVLEIPVNDIAQAGVGIRYANMVALGAFCNKTGIIKLETLKKSLKNIPGLLAVAQQ